jgi:lipopolysaccharide transport system ATP-binding protein
MYVRLAFAVNIVAGPDIMVVDEALSVGDMNFQAKCMTALTRVQKNGATVLFVSHDIAAVRSLCSRAIYLERGVVKAIGAAADVTELYVRVMREEMNAQQSDTTLRHARREESLSAPAALRQAGKLRFKRCADFERRVSHFRYGSGGARITSAELIEDEDNPVTEVKFDQRLRIVICVETRLEAELSFNYYIADSNKNYVIGSSMDLAGHGWLKSCNGGKYVVAYTTRLPLVEGAYSLQLEVTKPLVFDQTAEFLDVIDNAIVFRVSRRPNGRVWAQVYLDNEIEVIEE